MNYDIKVTPAQLKAVADWMLHGIEYAADVELAVDDRMLVAQQGDDLMAWDTDGSPATDTYLNANPPLDPTGSDRCRFVYVVSPYDTDASAWAFAREGDAQAMAATYGNDAHVERVTVCDEQMAAKMIAEREADE